MFGQVLNQIRVNHPDSVDTHELLMAAIEGMVSAADPHSFVIPAIRLQPGKEEQLHAGKLVPVPVNFAFVDGAPIVASVSAGSAAGHLDILPGDELVSVAGKPTDAASAEELDIDLAGPKGSEIKLGFERRRIDGSLVVLERSVKRERVEDATAIPAALMLDSATGYVRVTTFMGATVADDLHSALDSLEKSGMLQLVLDLRDNGGGSVSEAARVAGEFLRRAQLSTRPEGSKPELTDTGRVSRSFWQSQQRKYPIVMLIKRRNGEASELVAGRIAGSRSRADHGSAKLRQVAAHAGFPADGRLHDRAGSGPRAHAVRADRAARVSQHHTARVLAPCARGSRHSGAAGVQDGCGAHRLWRRRNLPDVLVDAQPGVPLWYSRVSEQLLPITWAGGYATARRHSGRSAHSSTRRSCRRRR